VAEQDAGVQTARVVCTEDGARSSTPKVEARRDGVHLELDNRLGEGGFEVSYGEGGSGGSAPTGESRQVVEIPPGEVRVGCFVNDSAEVPEDDYATFEVVDMDGSYTPTRLQCSDGRAMGSSGPSHGGESPEGEKGSLPALARRAFSESLQPGDVVEGAGYPEARERRSVRVVRDGKVVAMLDFQPSPEGWSPGSYTACLNF
jgi:hypothetical protein